MSLFRRLFSRNFLLFVGVVAALGASEVALAQVPGPVPGFTWCTGSRSCLTWSAVSGAMDYRVYRGEQGAIAALRNGNVDSCTFGTYASTTTGTTVTDSPSSGSFQWFLVTARNLSGEGSAGNGTAGARIVNSSGSCFAACTIAADCPAGRACNTTTQVCESICGDASHTACNGGCCSAGACVAGTANATCGSGGGACATCAGGTPTCTGGACVATCGGAGNGTCAGGFCCSGGQCISGDSSQACGYSGACANCAISGGGSSCIKDAENGPWFCGCNTPGDCLAANPATSTPGQACNTVSHLCGSSCNVPNVTQCNGGCCNAASSTCAVGTANNLCGASGLCSNCTASCTPGAACVDGSCGCTSDSSCSAGSCGLRHSCNVLTSTCCEGTGGACSSNGQCCSNVCNGTFCACIPPGQSCRGNPNLCCTHACGGDGNCQ